MRNLIIQYYIDTNLYSQPNYNNLGPNDMERYSRHSFELYAHKHGLEFLRITKPKLAYKHPTWERFDLWLEPSWFDRYDQIMYVDSDVIAMPHAPNIFAKHANLDSFKAACYIRYRSMPLEDQHKKQTNPNGIFDSVSSERMRQVRFQTGVFILTKRSAEHMLPWIRQYRDVDKQYNCDDGTFLNWAVMASGVAYEDMDKNWNVKNNGQSINFAEPNFLHCAGGKKYKMGYGLYGRLDKWFPNVNSADPVKS